MTYDLFGLLVYPIPGGAIPILVSAPGALPTFLPASAPL